MEILGMVFDPATFINMLVAGAIGGFVTWFLGRGPNKSTAHGFKTTLRYVAEALKDPDAVGFTLDKDGWPVGLVHKARVKDSLCLSENLVHKVEKAEN